MNTKNYGMYGLAIAGGAGVALWAGLPVSILLFLLVCPLMMFFMMRGMHGGQGNQQGHGGHQSADPDDAAGQSGKSVVDPSRLDGSHERIDRP
jgi:ATP-dependent Zn protease